PVPVTGVTVVPNSANRKFDVAISPRSILGNYTMVIGPDVRDFSGNPMNQDGDAINGETPSDQYTFTFSIVPFAGRYDFGIGTSPVADGYNQVLPNTTYTAAAGFGWLAGSVSGAARSTGTDLTSDLNYGSNITFGVDVPDGTYQVNLTIGDTGPYAH